MAIPTFVGAGTGVTIETGTGTSSKTGCTAGNIVIFYMYLDSTDAAGLGRSSQVNVEALDGTDSSLTVWHTGQQVGVTPQVGRTYYYIGRVMADGTCSQNYTVPTAGGDLITQVYEFSGVSTGTTLATVVENGGTTQTAAAAESVDLRDTAVTTNGPDRLAINLIGINANQALVAFTGQTGGTWVEAAAEYVGGGTVATLQLQTAEMASAGTIDGGSQTVTANGWVVFGAALMPAVAAPTLRIFQSNLRW